MKYGAVIERERAIEEPSAKMEKAKQYAAKHNLPAELADRMIEPWTAEQKEDARNDLRDMEHALVLDPALTKLIGPPNAAMALHLQMEDLAPKDELERMLVLQVKAMHGLTLRATRCAHATERMANYRDYANIANKSSRTFVALVEGLARHRGKTTEQKVTVEHVHVHAGGQAIVGSIDTEGRGGASLKSKELPHG